jgi:hypothetical protein
MDIYLPTNLNGCWHSSLFPSVGENIKYLATTEGDGSNVIYREFHEEMSILREVIVSIILSKNMCICMCTISNGFRYRAISLYSSIIVDKKEILRTVSTIGIYHSIDKLSTDYLL